MTRSDHQWAFLKDLAELVWFAGECMGWKLTGGELWRVPGSDRAKMNPTSQHPKRLAIDLNLFKPNADGRMVYVRATAQHKELGEFWESLSPFNRWGGRFRDGNHYERLEVSRDDAPQRWT